MRRWKFVGALAAISLIAAACGSDAEEPAVSSTLPMVEEVGSIVDVAQEAGQFETLLVAAEAAGLVDALRNGGPFTVFAPTDEAFAALPEGTIDSLLADTEALENVLLYHVIPGTVVAADVVTLSSATTANGDDVAISVTGSTVMVNDSTVTATDIEASNGVIHLIDKVLLPPAGEAATPGTIVEVAASAGSFETLLAAATAAGLVETLESDGPFTVFAPTDEAFAALPEGTIDGLLQDPEALSEILLYHVVPGEVLAADVVQLDSATTAQGADIAISVEGDVVKVNDATVIATDVAAQNGVIHVIDSVLLPPSN